MLDAHQAESNFPLESERLMFWKIGWKRRKNPFLFLKFHSTSKYSLAKKGCFLWI
jgi:hypothetical protein